MISVDIRQAFTKPMPTHHILKLHQDYHAAKRIGVKRFEIRLNDRDYLVGDTVQYINIDGSNIDGISHLVYDIVYITDFQQKDNWIVWSEQVNGRLSDYRGKFDG